jgi:hypothetical protein
VGHDGTNSNIRYLCPNICHAAVISPWVLRTQLEFDPCLNGDARHQDRRSVGFCGVSKAQGCTRLTCLQVAAGLPSHLFPKWFRTKSTCRSCSAQVCPRTQWGWLVIRIPSSIGTTREELIYLSQMLPTYKIALAHFLHWKEMVYQVETSPCQLWSVPVRIIANY